MWWGSLRRNDSINCTHPYGGIDGTNFGEPMLWVGVYVLLASAVCAAAMGADIIRSLIRSKPWIPPKFFVLNAAVITIVGVATKLPNDINAPMPGLEDQDAKLSGILLICVAMSHAMPSLGVMDNRELLSNMVALGILVVSTAVNIWFQIHTGVITRYAFVDGLSTIIMLLMFSMLVSHSLGVAAIKQLLEKQYQSKHREILSEVGDHRVPSGEELKGYVKKYWLMALSSSPDFVLLISGLFAACLLLNMVLTLIFFYSLFPHSGTIKKGCYMKSSDYKWTTDAICTVQILVVTAGCALFSFRLIHYRGSFGSFRNMVYVEKYRMQQLEKWKRDPLPFLARNERVRIAAYHAKNLGVLLIVLFQHFVTFLTRLLLLVVFYFLGVVPGFICIIICYPMCLICADRPGRGEGNAEGNRPSSEENMSGYVLLLEGGAVDDRKKIATEWKDYPEKWFAMGRKRSPRRLRELVSKSPSPPPPSEEGSSSRVLGLRTTSIRRSRSVTFEVLGNCWSLHLATLMSVIHAAFHADSEALERALHEGFLYFTMVDANNGRCSKKALEAGKMVWENLRFRREWLDQPLVDKQLPPMDFCEIIQDLKGRAAGHENEGLPEQLPLKALAAESMSRITGALQLDGDKPSWSLKEMEAEVAAVVESCLAELPTAILRECSNGRYGYREKHVRLAAQVLGETKEILKSLEARRVGTSTAACV